ncbi:MAG: hypothetical protein QNJ97_00780 [Myxococcota bacterium]|nr:hypothetical protein [Myxococcota bacterium]
MARYTIAIFSFCSAMLFFKSTAGYAQESQLPPLDDPPAAPEADGEAQLEGEEAVDLDNLEEEEIDLDDIEEEESSAGHPSGHTDAHRGGGDRMLHPKFKLFFDFLVEYEFESETFQFTKDHAYVVLELAATEWLSFRTDISLDPEFFDMTFHLGTSVDLSIGKVLIPFGQNEWHHLIGGRVDYQSLFLPVIWADYGISLKHRLFDGDVVGIDYSIYAVNGFQETTDANQNPFPSRLAGSLTDNNKMKGIGIRPVFRIWKIALGTSWYLDAWDAEGDNYMLFYGADIDFGFGFIPVPFLRNLRLRGEIAWGEVMLPEQNYYQGILAYGTRRSGYNIEASFNIVRWLTLRYREGRLNSDSRFEDAGDLLIHEPGIIARAGPVSFYLILQLHDPLVEDPDPPPEDNSCLFFRVLFRY